MGRGHDHRPDTLRHERPLRWALALTLAFLVVEVVGALLSGSLALLSDAAHMASDSFALLVALLAVRLARRPPDTHRTYGYARAEALGALANGCLLFLVAGGIFWEAVQRFLAPEPVATGTMLAVAVAGLVVNLIAMRLLQAGAGENLNMRGAYLEVMADLLGSVAVILGALVIRFTGLVWVDPLLAVLLALWVLPRTWHLLSEAVHLLLEGAPRGIAVQEVREAMLAEPGVVSIHDLHLWSLSSRQPMLSAHVDVRRDVDADALRRRLARLVRERFGIGHSTIQMEAERGGGGGESADCGHVPHDESGPRHHHRH
ncbi:cation diffusion facilitator family transporter [Arenimonas fontis]|uniref:Cation transporter n=1 Tax=Arenimonas fontis TaxID=2608255 RepID=A0A5B2ZAX7_9GAMM|nr:cation diffusion facilitator family transporter [Arenimonas fontis]KAA2285105.1 cation transporter [Arenimonas fontis]